MPSDPTASLAAMQRLEPFLGEWSIEASFEGEPGTTTFEWELGGHLLAQRSTIPHPAAPDALSLIGYDATGGEGEYTQHYFDSRGVARVYAMTFKGDGVWTLERLTADFTPLDFSQRFTGTFSAGGDAITGRWETSQDGVTWETDFELGYRRTR